MFTSNAAGIALELSSIPSSLALSQLWTAMARPVWSQNDAAGRHIIGGKTWHYIRQSLDAAAAAAAAAADDDDDHGHGDGNAEDDVVFLFLMGER